PERLALLATVKQNGAIDQTLEFKLNDEIHGTAAHSYEYLAEVGEEYDEARRSGEQVARLTRQVVERLLHRLDGDGPVTKQEIDSVLEAVGADDIVRERIAFDVVLPNLRLVNAPPAWRFTKGTRARLAIVDTGIAPRHRDLRVVGGVSYVPGVSSWHDDHGHGTHCAGISAGLMNRRGIVGVAPQADVFAVKVLNRYGSGMKSWVLNGLLWCARFGIHVVNLSLGRRATTHNPATFDAAYEHVGRILRRRGIIAVAAAGNDGHKPVGDPARCPSYMAVSAVDFSRRLTTFTNIGPQVEVCAPGLQILSTVPTGYRRMSGTSMATPHVAGAAALVKSRHPSIHGDSIRLRLMLSATDLGGAGRDWAFGHGLLNAYQAIQ
ncbi:MAG: S8 family peptidase, partial [Rhodothermales bacterium]|nr:S8 family peptidase [Rhodothermales bacterium]